MSSTLTLPVIYPRSTPYCFVCANGWRTDVQLHKHLPMGDTYCMMKDVWYDKSSHVTYSCPICLDILFQPLELSCRTLLCTTCTVNWFTAFNCSGLKFPHCFSDEPLIASHLKPAPPIVFTLLDLHERIKGWRLP